MVVNGQSAPRPVANLSGRRLLCASLRNSGVEAPLDRPRYPLSSLAQRRVVEMRVAVRRGAPPVTKQASGDMQAFAVHNRVRGVRMAQVMQPRIRHDPGHVARLDPERVERMFSQRFILDLTGKHPLPGGRSGEAVQQLPRRLAKQNVPGPGLGVAQGEPVEFDLAPAQAAYLSQPCIRSTE